MIRLSLLLLSSVLAGCASDVSHTPTGTRQLFNGENLDGWKGLVGNPMSRAKMSPSELAAAQAVADERMHAHWAAVDGVLVFDGNGDSLVTVEDFEDFELLVDWKIKPEGDSGIYLRGSPQVRRTSLASLSRHPRRACLS